VSEIEKGPSPSSGVGLSSATREWVEQGDPKRRKQLGQYMTPAFVTEALLKKLPLEAGLSVLDPGVGTGELLRGVLDRQPKIEAVGWDIDQGVIEAARTLVPEARLEARSALEVSPREGFDLVVGNPPYFQLKLDPEMRSHFSEVISGRANIFALFFQIGLEQLKPGGYLGYIVPPSMNSGAYFEALREYISGQAVIQDMTILDGTDIFEGANTAVQLLVLRKNEHPTEGSDDFVFRREVPEAGFRRVVFTPEPDALEAEFKGRRTLWELGLEAATGQVIWNENRQRLCSGPGPGRVPLVWSHSIDPGSSRVSFDASPGRAGKPGFYDTSKGGRQALHGPAIVVNRVVGAVGRGELRAALVPEGKEFLAENHVNVIRARPGAGRAVDWERILSSLRSPGVASRVRLLTGNTQISARELTHLLPLD
jgi:adenine-specific DNA-methyltransferase